MKDKNQWIEVVAFALPLLIASSLFFSCKQDKLVNDWTRMNLSGYVMTIKEHSFKAIDTLGEIVQGERMSPAGDVILILYLIERGTKWKKTFTETMEKCGPKACSRMTRTEKK